MLEDFYSIESKTIKEDSSELLVSTNREHWIYKVHFPEKPIFPGAMHIYIVQKMVSMLLNGRYRISSISSSRFFAIIDPSKQDKILYKISFVKENQQVEGADNKHDNFEVKIKCMVLSPSEDKTFAKISLTLIPYL